MNDYKYDSVIDTSPLFTIVPDLRDYIVLTGAHYISISYDQHHPHQLVMEPDTEHVDLHKGAFDSIMDYQNTTK